MRTLSLLQRQLLTLTCLKAERLRPTITYYCHLACLFGAEGGSSYFSAFPIEIYFISSSGTETFHFTVGPGIGESGEEFDNGG